MVLLACVKEDMGIVIVFFGVWLVANGDRRAGLATVAGGALAYLFAVEVAIPHFGDGFDYWTYDAVGSDPLDAVFETVKQPWLPFEVALDQPEKRRLLLFLTLPFLLLPLLSRTVIVAIPLIAERVLSSNPLFWETEYHYGLPLAPVLAMATAGGLATVLAWLPEARRNTASKVAAGALIALAAAACWAGPGVPGLVRTFAPTPGFDAAGEAAVDRVPEDGSVITHDFVYPHVAARGSADIFREGAGRPEWMILAPFADRGDATGAGSVRELAAREIRPRLAGYRPVWERDGWIVLRRGVGRGTLDRRACARLRKRTRTAPRELGADVVVTALCGRG